jgi:enamine deaminase RidA (YjgF/YER057c/UK114 family)
MLEKAMHQTLFPQGWAKPKGYANGILAKPGAQIFVGGQIGWNGQCVFENDDFIHQVKQTLSNIIVVLAEAGAGPEHIVRMTWYITNKQEYIDNIAALGAAYRSVMGRNFPAMSVVQVVALVEDRAKVEIEVTAVL